MTTTRTAAFALVLMTGTAFAAPASRDNMFQRFGKSATASAHYFKADLAERNAKAGPGLFKRTMTKMGQNIAATKTAIGREVLATQMAVGREVAATKRVIGGEVASMKHAVGREIAATKTAVANVGRDVVQGTKNAAYATKMGMLNARANHLQGVADRAQRRASDANLTAYRNERGNEKFNADYKAAAKANGVTGLRAEVLMNTGFAAANTAFAVMPGNPIAVVNAGVATANVGAAMMAKHELAGAKRAAAESAVNKNVVPASRFSTWAKGGTIDPALAK